MTSSARPTDGESPTGPAEVVPADSSLTVVLDDGSGTRQTWQLVCSADGAVGGDHPDAQNACTAIGAAEDPWAPVPEDMACTMVFGGPQTATVRGTWNGVAVDTTFNRTDGCEISRWDRVAPLLQPGTTAGRRSGAL